MDKTLITERFGACLPTYHTEASVQKKICQNLAQSVPEQNYNNVVEIGCGTGFLTQILLNKHQAKNWLINDLVPVAEKWIAPLSEQYNDKNIHFLFGDAEQMPLPDHQGLIVSASTVQWFEDLRFFFKRCETSLDEDGVLAISTFGPENMIEIKETSGVGLDYPCMDQLKSFLPEKLELIEAREEQIVLQFDNASEVLNHIRKTGVNGISREAWTKSRFLKFCKSYEEKFSVGNQVTLTYHPIYLICRKKK